MNDTIFFENMCGLHVCKENGIVLLTLSPLTSHKIQPLDRSVFLPFKNFYNEAFSSFMINNSGKPISLYDIPELIGKAFNPINI